LELLGSGEAALLASSGHQGSLLEGTHPACGEAGRGLLDTDALGHVRAEAAAEGVGDLLLEALGELAQLRSGSKDGLPAGGCLLLEELLLLEDGLALGGLGLGDEGVFRARGLGAADGVFERGGLGYGRGHRLDPSGGLGGRNIKGLAFGARGVAFKDLELALALGAGKGFAGFGHAAGEDNGTVGANGGTASALEAEEGGIVSLADLAADAEALALGFEFGGCGAPSDGKSATELGEGGSAAGHEALDLFMGEALADLAALEGASGLEGGAQELLGFVFGEGVGYALGGQGFGASQLFGGGHAGLAFELLAFLEEAQGSGGVEGYLEAGFLSGETKELPALSYVELEGFGLARGEAVALLLEGEGRHELTHEARK
jgi:hypothetical protein